MNYCAFVQPIDPKKIKDEVAQAEAELNALAAQHKEWKNYFSLQSAMSLKEKLEPPTLKFPPVNPQLN
jgi:hypothetical protein